MPDYYMVRCTNDDAQEKVLHFKQESLFDAVNTFVRLSVSEEPVFVEVEFCVKGELQLDKFGFIGWLYAFQGHHAGLSLFLTLFKDPPQTSEEYMLGSMLRQSSGKLNMVFMMTSGKLGTRERMHFTSILAAMVSNQPRSIHSGDVTVTYEPIPFAVGYPDYGRK